MIRNSSGKNSPQSIFPGANFFFRLFQNLGKSELHFSTPEIDQISDREIQSDEYVSGKVTFRIEKSNPMNIW